jgi:colanic acid/amylovoran biosynthesis glycosyltransferase
VRVHAFARRFPSLSQTFVLDQCLGLLRLGVDLTVFADGDDGTGIVHPDACDAALADRVRHHDIPVRWPRRIGEAARLVGGTSALTVQQRAALLDPRFGREALSLRLLFQGSGVAAAPRADVLHAHFGPVGAMVDALRASSAIDAPLVTTFYGYDVSRTPASTYRRLFRTGDAFLVLGESMRRRLVEMGAPPARVHVHPLGVDLARFAPARRSPARKDSLALLSIARLVPKKGIEYALRAVARVARAHPNVRYTIVGDGPLRGALEALAHELALGSAVRFTGWLPRPEVLRIARDADVLLAPSITAADGDAEGTPLAILEAAALGLPVAASRHAGIPDVVVENETALLVDERDVNGLAAAIDSLSDPALRQKLGDAGRAFVERQHDIRALNHALLARLEMMAGAR